MPILRGGGWCLVVRPRYGPLGGEFLLSEDIEAFICRHIEAVVAVAVAIADELVSVPVHLGAPGPASPVVLVLLLMVVSLGLHAAIRPPGRRSIILVHKSQTHSKI